MDSLFVLSRLVMGGVWLYAGAAKLWYRTSLAGILEGFGLKNPELVRIIDKAAPYFELALGASFFYQPVAMIGGVVSLILLLAFIERFVRIIRAGALLSCNCFGEKNEAISWLDVFRNAYFALLSLMTVISPSIVFHFDAQIIGGIPVMGMLPIIYWQLKWMGKIGKNISIANNNVFLDFYGVRFLIGLSNKLRLGGK